MFIVTPDRHETKDNLAPYFQEWQASGVVSILIALNARAIDGPEAFELHHRNQQLDRTNTGRLTEKWLRKYEVFDQAGFWGVSGVNPLDGSDSGYIRLKQISGEPVLRDEKGKQVKYLSPAGEGTHPIFLKHPDQNYWPKVISDNSPITITEGEKKAGCLLSRNVSAVSIPGIWNGCRSVKEAGKTVGHTLHPDLEPFDTHDRVIKILFDYRKDKQKWYQTELKAAVTLARCFKRATVQIAQLPGPDKGVDDFIVAGGDINKIIIRPLSDFTDEIIQGKQISREDWYDRYGWQDDYKSLADSIKQFFDRATFKHWKRSGNLPENPQPNPELAEITAIKRYRDPVKYYKSGERKQVWLDAVNQGYKYILDQSVMGLGKSHDAGTLTPEDFGKKQIVYLASDHRNPTTETIEENYTDLETRHDGLVTDYTRVTALGNPHVRRPKTGEIADIPGNCPETQTFLKLERKGIREHGGKGSSICEHCPLFEGCGFLASRSQGLQAERVRAHIDQIPSKDNENKIVIVDEPARLLKPTTTKLVGRGELERLNTRLMTDNYDLFDLLSPNIITLYNLMNSEKPYHGLNHLDIKPQLASLTDLLIDELVDSDGDGDGETREGVLSKLKELCKPKLHKLFKDKSPEQKQDLIDTGLTFNWLPDLIAILEGERRGYLRLDDQGLHMTLRSNHHSKIIKSFDHAVFLDSTLTQGDLALMIGCKADEILVICEKSPDNSNLTINVVNGLGVASQRRESQQERIDAAINAIKRNHEPNTVDVLDLKRYSKDGMGYWFHDNRGSNRYLDTQTLIGVGLPTPNLGQMAAEYAILTGETVNPSDYSNAGFQAFVRRKTYSELTQFIGRLRAHRRGVQKLSCYLLADIPSQYVRMLPELFPGATVNEIEAYDLTPEAAKAGERNLRATIEALWKGLQSGVTVRGQDIAARLGVTKGHLSKLLSAFGGFRGLVKSLLMLIRLHKAKGNFEKLPPDLQYLVTEYLPGIAKDFKDNLRAAEAYQELLGIVQAYGQRAFQLAIGCLDIETRGTFIQAGLNLFPDDLRGNLRESLSG